MKILVTGAAGFIGFHLSRRLLERGDTVVGIDNINDYYDPQLKHHRLEQLTPHPNFSFHQYDVAHRAEIAALFKNHHFDRVIHLAAQAGVRYSIENPQAYIDSNLVGFGNILEGCRHANTAHLIYASSSSVYGKNKVHPFSEQHNVDHPVSLYAATKKANELMAHTYSNLYQLPTTGLRFFTVYGPWGRPDMAPYKFTKGITQGDTIDIYNHGDMIRDFTYIDDIIEGVVRVSDHIPKGQTEQATGSNAQPTPPAITPANSYAPYQIFNIGNNAPVQLMDFIRAIETSVGKEAIKNMMPMQPGDVPVTCADVSALQAAVGFKPKTSIEHGVEKFVAWYKDYYAQ